MRSEEGLKKWLEFLKPEDLRGEESAEFAAHRDYLTDTDGDGSPLSPADIPADSFCEVPLERAEFKAMKATVCWMFDQGIIEDFPSGRGAAGEWRNGASFRGAK